MYSLPFLETSRSSSNSGEKPRRMMPPSAEDAAGASSSASPTSVTTESHGSRRSPSRERCPVEPSISVFRRATASIPSFRDATSLGMAVPAAMRLRSRSRSGTALRTSMTSSLRIWSLKRASTASWRCSSWLRSRRGCPTHLLRSRPPIDVLVMSRVARRECAVLPHLPPWNSSRLLRVWWSRSMKALGEYV